MHRKGRETMTHESFEEHEGRQQAEEASIKELLDSIPADTDKTELPRLLGQVLRQLARMDKAEAEPYLGYAIKERFGLSVRDIDGYRERVNKDRKQLADSENNGGDSDNDKPVYRAVFGGLVEIVEHEGKPAFLIKDGDELSISAQAERGDVVYDPPPADQIPWLLPRGEEVLRHYEEGIGQSAATVDAALYDHLVDYHGRISELPSVEYYDLIAAWDMHTYLLEAFQYSPIIWMFAVPGRGKSRTGKGMVYVAYRGLHAESLREAYIVRMAENYGATIFFDVMDIWDKAKRNGTEDILLQRFEKGAKVPRIMYPELGAFRDTVYFSIFGPTIIGTNVPAHEILATRAITINMPETTRQFENDVRPEDGLRLKERLVAFRARHLGAELPEVDKPAQRRLGDILKPLLQIIRLARPERESAFMELVRKIEEGRMMDKAETLEAQILRSVKALENEVSGGKLAVKAITDHVNLDKPERLHFRPHTIGWRLKAMGFDKGRTSTGAAAIIYDSLMLGQIMRQYGLQQTSESSETSETSVENAGETGDSDDLETSFQGFLHSTQEQVWPDLDAEEAQADDSQESQG